MNEHSSQPHSLTLLIVEDDLDSQELFCELLSLSGHHATGVSSAEQALESIAAHRYDVLITDVNLPGMSGIDLARQCVKLAPAMHRILASGYGSMVMAGLDFSAHVLPKPFSFDHLQQLLAELTAAD